MPMQNPCVCSGPTSQLPSPASEFEVEPITFSVAPAAPLQAESQAAVTLTGELGTPGATPCKKRGSQGSPPAFRRGDTPFPGFYSPQEGLPLFQP